MPKPKTATGEKNLIGQRLIELRRQHHMSQRLLAYQLQLNGYDMDKNVITRIETNKRYVTDIELKALTEIFQVFNLYTVKFCRSCSYELFQSSLSSNPTTLSLTIL